MPDHTTSLPLADCGPASLVRLPATFAAITPTGGVRLPDQSGGHRLVTGRIVNTVAEQLQTGTQTTSSVSQPVAAPISGGDVLVAGSGIFGTLLVIAATAVIAVKQGRIVLVDSRSREAERAERRIVRERRARQETWRDEHDSILALLNRAESMVYEISENGPHTSRELERFGAAKFGLRARQLADRRLPALSGPLLRLSGIAQELAQAGMPDPCEIEAVWQAGLEASVPEHLTAVAVQR